MKKLLFLAGLLLAGTQLLFGQVNYYGNLIGNATMATNAYAAKQAYTISALGIANSLSTITNDGAPFGIDTPGTLSCGIQEWINSLMQPTNKLNPGGGKATLSPGIFNLYTNVMFTNNFVVGWELAGLGMAATILHDNTTNGNTLTVTPNSTNGPCIAFNAHDFGLYSVNKQAALISTLETSQAIFERLAMGSWKCLTNNGASDSLESGPGAGTRSLEPDTWSPANEKPGLICILDNGTTGNSYVIRDCIFVNPATAISTEADHITIERNSFQACGCWNSNSVRVYQTAWSTNSEYSIGADITIENGGIGDRRIVGNQHFNGQAGYLNLDESHAVICQDEIFELMNYTAITEQGLTSIGFNFSQASAPAGNSADIIYCPDCPNSGGYLLTGATKPSPGVSMGGFVNELSYSTGDPYFEVINTDFRIKRNGSLIADGIISAGGSPYGPITGGTITGTGFVGNGSGLTNVEDFTILSATNYTATFTGRPMKYLVTNTPNFFLKLAGGYGDASFYISASNNLYGDLFNNPSVHWGPGSNSIATNFGVLSVSSFGTNHVVSAMYQW